MYEKAGDTGVNIAFFVLGQASLAERDYMNSYTVEVTKELFQLFFLS